MSQSHNQNGHNVQRVPGPEFFGSAAGFRKWLEDNHDRATELWVGYRKKATGLPSMTWAESVDEALCFGWIDGIRKSVDETSYMIRFTPRKPTSIWSDVNIRRAQELIDEGRMRPAGRAAFDRRREDLSRRYSFEQGEVAFDRALEKRFRANRAAWKAFSAMPPGYRKMVTWWVISAKKEETRLRRLDQLIAESAAGRKIAAMRRPGE